MSLDEFTQMLGDAGLLNEHFGNREVGPLWNLSMMTNKDELNSERHLNMTFVEFLEAIARVADRFEMAVRWHDRGVDVPGVNHLLLRIVEGGAAGSGEPDGIPRKAGLGEDHQFRPGFRGGMDVPHDSL